MNTKAPASATPAAETPAAGIPRIQADIARFGHLPEPEPETPNLARWPSTYARDYARSHPQVIGWEAPGDWGSRALAGDAIRAYSARTGQDVVQVFVALADAYLDKYEILPVSGPQRDARIGDAEIEEAAYVRSRR